MSRHYSDLARMIEMGVGDAALGKMDLFDRVVEHRSVFFGYIIEAVVSRPRAEVTNEGSVMEYHEPQHKRTEVEVGRSGLAPAEAIEPLQQYGPQRPS